MSITGVNSNQTVGNLSKNKLYIETDKQNQEYKTNNNIKYLTVGMAALTAIGIATFAIMSRSGKKSIVNNLNKINELKNQKSELLNEISGLKQSIKDNYLNKKYNVLDELGTKCSNSFIEKVAIRGNKSELDNALKEIKTYKDDMSKLSTKIRERFKGKLVSDVNGKLKYQGGLLDDKEWKEFGKLRKLYRKQIQAGNYDNMYKLNLVNEIIKAKLTGKCIKLNGKELPFADAINMVKDSKSTNQTIQSYLFEKNYLLRGQSSPFGNERYIAIEDFVPGANDIISNYKRVPGIKKSLSEINELRNAKRVLMVNLANETRSGNDVKRLKELQLKLKTVSAELNSLQSV